MNNNIIPIDRDPRADNAVKYDPDVHPQWVRDLAQKGKFPAAWCAIMGVHRVTIWRWQTAHPEFREALAQAKEILQAYWEEKFSKAMDSPNANASMYTKLMATRFPKNWGKEPETIEDFYTPPAEDLPTNEDGAPLDAESLKIIPDDELRKRIAQLTERMKYSD